MKLRNLIAAGILAAAAAGAGDYSYSRFLFPPLVTTSYASLAPVSEAVYGTGTVEPERWAKVVPLQRRRLVERLPSQDRDAIVRGCCLNDLFDTLFIANIARIDANTIHHFCGDKC